MKPREAQQKVSPQVLITVLFIIILQIPLTVQFSLKVRNEKDNTYWSVYTFHHRYSNMSDKLFIIQLITSFVVGGGFIGLQSFIAEKAGRKLSGIILTFPSTIALGFFFLGWALSPETVAKVVPSTLIPLGLTVLFTAIYAYLAENISRIIGDRSRQIIFTFGISLTFWFIFSLPFAILEIDNLPVGITGYFLLTLLTHVLLHRKKHEKPTRLQYTPMQKVGRALFAGLIIFLVVLLGKLLSPFWGGVFAMFPAAFSSMLLILHWYYGPESLFPGFQKVPLGSLSLFSYAIAAMFVFPEFGFVIGTLISYAVSIVLVLLLVMLTKKTT